MISLQFDSKYGSLLGSLCVVEINSNEHVANKI